MSSCALSIMSNMGPKSGVCEYAEYLSFFEQIGFALSNNPALFGVFLSIGSIVCFAKAYSINKKRGNYELV